MTAAEEKTVLRRAVRARERALSPEEKARGDAAICERVAALAAYRAAGTVFAFVGTAREIQTDALLRETLRQGKRLCVPRCAEGNTMTLCRIMGREDLAPGAYGILEPKADCETVAPEEVDFAVVPCVSCDLAGNRLGQGGGYYDRFFAGYTGEAALVCREALLCERVPTEAHDRRFSVLVTEEKVYRIE